MTIFLCNSWGVTIRANVDVNTINPLDYKTRSPEGLLVVPAEARKRKANFRSRALHRLGELSLRRTASFRSQALDWESLDSKGQQAVETKQILLYYYCTTIVLLCTTTVLLLYYGNFAKIL